LLDNQVGPNQLQPARIQAPDAQELLARVEVHPDEQFTAAIPKNSMPESPSIPKTSNSGEKATRWEGGLSNPMSWTGPWRSSSG